MLSFKKFLTEVFSLDLQPRGRGIYILNNPKEASQQDTIVLDTKSPSSEYRLAGHAVINPTARRLTIYGKDEYTYRILPTLEIKVSDGNDRKLLFHYGRYRDIPQTDDSFARGFLAEMVRNTTNRLMSAEPDIILEVRSKERFNSDVVKEYRGYKQHRSENSIRTDIIGKITFEELAKRIFDYLKPNATIGDITKEILRQGLVHFESTGRNETERVRSVTVAYAYAFLLTDIKDNDLVPIYLRGVIRNAIGRKTEVSVELIANALKNYADEVALTYKQAQITTLKDMTISKAYLKPNGFFRLPEELEAVTKIAIVDDNINTKATCEEINKKIRLHNPNAEITWVVGIVNI